MNYLESLVHQDMMSMLVGDEKLKEGIHWDTDLIRQALDNLYNIKIKHSMA